MGRRRCPAEPRGCSRPRLPAPCPRPLPRRASEDALRSPRLPGPRGGNPGVCMQASLPARGPVRAQGHTRVRVYEGCAGWARDPTLEEDPEHRRPPSPAQPRGLFHLVVVPYPVTRGTPLCPVGTRPDRPPLPPPQAPLSRCGHEPPPLNRLQPSLRVPAPGKTPRPAWPTPRAEQGYTPLWQTETRDPGPGLPGSRHGPACTSRVPGTPFAAASHAPPRWIHSYSLEVTFPVPFGAPCPASLSSGKAERGLPWSTARVGASPELWLWAKPCPL